MSAGCAKVLLFKNNPTNHHPLSLSDHKSLEMKYLISIVTSFALLFVVGLSCVAQIETTFNVDMRFWKRLRRRSDH